MEQPTSEQAQHGMAGEGGGDLRSDAQRLGSSAANRLHSEVEARKGQAVEQVKSVSSAVQNAAGQLGEESPEWLKSAIRGAGVQIQRFADTIEQKTSRELLHDVEGFARDNPVTFLAACAAAGFAAARIFKAGAGQPTGAEGASVSRPPGEVA